MTILDLLTKLAEVLWKWENFLNNQLDWAGGPDKLSDPLGTGTRPLMDSAGNIFELETPAELARLTLGGNGVLDFLALNDTPADYTGNATKVLTVNLAENAIVFSDPTTLGGGELGATEFTGLNDTPGSYVDQASKWVRVNALGTALEFADLPAASPGVTTFLGLDDTPLNFVANYVVAANATGDGLIFVPWPSFATTFTQLTDTPPVLTADKWLKVNALGTALEWADLPASATYAFLGLTDTPADFSGASNKLLAVNPTADGITFVDPLIGTFTGLSDTPVSITPAKFLRGAAGGTALEWADLTFAQLTDVAAPAGNQILRTTDLGQIVWDGYPHFLDLGDTPQTYAAEKWVKVNSDGTGLEFANPPSLLQQSDQRLVVFLPNTPKVNDLLFSHVFDEAASFDAGLSMSTGYARVAPTSDVSFPIYKNTVQVGSIDFASGSNTPTFTFSNIVTFNVGDYLSVYGPEFSAAGISYITVTLVSGIGDPFRLDLFIYGPVETNEKVFGFVAAKTFTLPAGLPVSQAYAHSYPNYDYTFYIYKNTTQIGTIDFLAGANNGTFTLTSDVTFVAGDRLSIIAYEYSDDLLEDISIVLVASGDVASTIVSGFAGGTLVDSDVVVMYSAPQAFTLPVDLTDSQAYADTAATGAVTLDLQKNGVSIGSVDFAAGANTGTFTLSSAVPFAITDRLALVGPATADATLADVAVSFVGV